LELNDLRFIFQAQFGRLQQCLAHNPLSGPAGSLPTLSGSAKNEQPNPTKHDQMYFL
jgi:hypothetical protein